MKTQSELNLMSWQRPKVRTMKFAVLALAFTLAAFTLPTSTWAGEVFRSRVKGPLAQADFFTNEECIVTEVFIEAFDNIVHEPPGPPNSRSEVFVNISQFDLCNQEFVLSAIGSATLSDSDFQVSKKIESARLITTIEVFDFVSESLFNVSIDVSWTATGEPEKVNSRFQSRSPGFFFNEQLRATTREAAAAGTVSDGTTNFIQTPSFSFADIRDVTDGIVSVIKF
jgi:hypothetical protein